MAKPIWTTVTQKPLTGILDNRSLPADMPPGAFRTRLNWMSSAGTKLCRRPGHERLFPDLAYDPNHASTDPLYAPRYINWDLHDQNVDGTPVAREPITSIFEGYNNLGTRYLYAGSQTRMNLLNETTGLWTRLTTPGALGGSDPQTRFKIAELQETLVLVNGVDQILYTTVGTGGLATIAELSNNGTLAQKLNIAGARVVTQYNGFMLIMNFVEDGTRMSSRVRWSDLNRPLVWIGPTDTNIPDEGHGEQASLADFQDLDYGSDILAAAELFGQLYIFTTTAIWRATIGSTKAFNFAKVYSEPKNGARCIFFPNTLVSTGADLLYAASDGIYRYNPYIIEPERLEWLYRGTAEAFTDTGFAGDVAYCQSVIMQAHPSEFEIYLSWPQLGSHGSNTRTLAINYQYSNVSSIDFGYSAMANYRPNPEAGNVCKTERILVAAAADDWCLKQIGTAYSRERCANSATGAGTVANNTYAPFAGAYVYDGYFSTLTGLLPLQNYDAAKEISRFLIEAASGAQANPCVIRLRLGNCYSQADPALPDGLCAVIWHRLPDKPLKCLDTRTGAQSAAQNLVRALGTEWATLYGGRFLFFEIVIANADGTAAVGGSCCFERFEMQIRLLPKT